MNASQPTTKYTITTAHRITGKSRTTLQRHIKSGKLSCTEDHDGNRQIDASELIRVYGDACVFPREEGSSANPTPQPMGNDATMHHRLDSVQQQLDTMSEERRREREQLQSQIDHLQESLGLAQEGHNRATLLLESRSSGGGEWAASLQSLEEQIANQADRFEKRVGELQVEAQTNALDEIKNQPWWRLLFR